MKRKFYRYNFNEFIIKRKLTLSISLLFFVGIGLMNINCLVGEKNKVSLFLKNMEALADNPENETWGCAGNPTFVPNQTLKSVICLSGGTHLKCKSENRVCCDPSKQTDCPPIDIIPLRSSN